MTNSLQTAQRSGMRAWAFTRRVGLHEIVVVVIAFLIYFAIRGAVVDRESDALAHANDILSFERTLHFAWEPHMQSWILGHYWLIKTWNWVYFWGHMPLVIAFAVWLYVRHRREYFLTRNAFLASGAIAVVIYALYPVAPPRLLVGAGFVDTMAIYDRVSYSAQEARPFVNPYAAVPSLHFGWSLLLGYMIARVGKNAFFVSFGVIWPIAMFFGVVLTGNHFIFDTIIGAVVSFAGLGIAYIIEQRQEQWRAWLRARLASSLPPAQRSE